MKSAFGSKRKARKIQVDEEEDGAAKDIAGANQSASSPSTTTTANPPRKSFKKSSLRQSINFDDLQQEEDGVALLNKQSLGRSGSMVKKKKAAASRLSFGPGEIISGDAAEALEEESFTPVKKGLGRRVVEKTTLSGRDDDDERPTYSKDYLNELRSSTPNSKPTMVEAEEELGLDELEGAMVVNMETKAAYIPTEAEIREKKERRARLAHEEDFISLNDDGGSRSELQILLSRKKKPASRLVREEEDLGEGFDEFVNDGRIALGKKQERVARRQQRKEMAAMINDAEGTSDEESDDSEAERRAAYEVAQTRAGMDGLHKPADLEEESSIQIPSKITPLPNLVDSIKAFQITLSEMEQDMARRKSNLADLEKEKTEILAREVEVQELLKQAGQRYSALKPSSSNSKMADAQEVLDAHENGFSDRMTDRGLESFGNTPIAVRPAIDD